MIRSETLAARFSALSHPVRVDVFLCLLTSPNQPKTFGRLSKEVDVPPSTLTHHLKEMESGGILTRTRAGRETEIRLRLDELESMLTQMLTLCCAAVGPDTGPNSDSDQTPEISQ